MVATVVATDAGSAHIVSDRAKPSTIRINIVDKTYVSATARARDGDTILFCNEDPFNNSPFGYSQYNHFGTKVPGKSYGSFLLHSGECRGWTIHNPTKDLRIVKVFDELHAGAKLEIVVAPAGWTGKVPTVAEFRAEPTPTVSVGAFPGSTITELTLTLGKATAVTNLKSGHSGSVDTTARNTETLSGSVSLNGTLPKGWVVVVWYPTPDFILFQGDKSGSFSGVTAEPTGLVGRNGAGAYICPSKAPPVCDSSGQANVFVNWTAP